MKLSSAILANLAGVAPLVAAGPLDPLTSPYGRDRFGNAPPATFSYAWPSTLRLGDETLGDIDSTEFAVSYVEAFGGGERWDWLAGANWRRHQFDLPAGAPLPDSAQAATAVVGVHWRIDDHWRARLEVQPGVYSDFDNVTGSDVNAPVLVEAAYRFHDQLEIGVQLNLDAFRESPVIGSVGVSWRIDDRWLLSLWIPRPQLEFAIDDRWTAFAGASLAGGSFRVAEDFGQATGRPGLDDALVDYREIRAGAGVRLTMRDRLTIELAGGWLLGRRFEFHREDLTADSEGAPYIQFSLGAAW
jgi:hypothetical protein